MKNSFTQRSTHLSLLGLTLGIALLLAGCKTPSEKYGLAPPDSSEAYPQFVAPQPHERPLPSPEEQAKAIANLERSAQRQGQISGAQLRVRGVNGQ